MNIHTIVKLNVKGTEKQEQSNFCLLFCILVHLVHNSLLAISDSSTVKLSIESAACHHNDDFVQKYCSHTAECIQDRNILVFPLIFTVIFLNIALCSNRFFVQEL